MRWPSFYRSRLYSRRLAGSRLAVGFFGVVAALAAPLLILLFGAFVDLLATRGNLQVPADARAATDELAGRESDRNGGRWSWYNDRGLLPLVYRLREQPFGPTLGRMYRAWSALQTNKGVLWVLAISGWLVALVECLALYLLELAVQRLALDTVFRLRLEMQRQAVRLGESDWLSSRRFGPMDLFGDTLEVLRHGLVVWWRVMPFAMLLAALLVVLMLSTQIWLALAALILGGLSWLLLGWLQRRARGLRAVWADRASPQVPLFVESLRRARQMPGAVGEASSDQFAVDLQRLQPPALEQHTASSAVVPLVFYFLLAGACLLLLLVGAIVTLEESPPLSLAGLAVLAAALTSLIFPLLRAARLRRALPRAEQAASEVLHYLDRDPSVGQVASAQPLSRLQQSVEFERVSLADDRGRRLLDDLTLSLPAGSRVAIVSSDPLAPTALAGLLPRYYEPVAGRLQIDGHDIRLATLESLRGQICLIVPDQALFSGTVSENISCGDPRFTLTQITEAARGANAYEFVQGLPQGFQTMIGEHGMRLDPSQVLRIALARALLHDPAIVLLEEPREEMGPKSAALVDEAFDRVGKNRLLILLAGRVATLRAAPRILLFHEGRLVAEGNHQELLQQSELYRHLNYVRFNEFRDLVK